MNSEPEFGIDAHRSALQMVPPDTEKLVLHPGSADEPSVARGKDPIAMFALDPPAAHTSEKLEKANAFASKGRLCTVVFVS